MACDSRKKQIIAELEHLSAAELLEVKRRVAELEARKDVPKQKSWRETLKPLIGGAVDLPEDMAEHHDHYLHGLPKP